MILNTDQWIRLQTNVKEALPWFQKYDLFPGRRVVFEKISDSTLHELQQIRKVDDWSIFLKDISEENRIELECIINFANGRKSIDWSDFSDNYRELKDDFLLHLECKEEYKKGWKVRHNYFGLKFDSTSFIHYDLKDRSYNGMVWVCQNSNKNETWGIAISEKEYVPISVEF